MPRGCVRARPPSPVVTEGKGLFLFGGRRVLIRARPFTVGSLEFSVSCMALFLPNAAAAGDEPLLFDLRCQETVMRFDRYPLGIGQAQSCRSVASYASDARVGMLPIRGVAAEP